MSLIGKSIGNYQIKAKLGEGGMGAVYLGEHPLIGKHVAVKVLLEELLVEGGHRHALLQRGQGGQRHRPPEHRRHRRLRQDEERLRAATSSTSSWSSSTANRSPRGSAAPGSPSTRRCTSWSSAARRCPRRHAKGIVHRDLKPENIYLCPRGGDKNFVKLLDFGIAKLTGDGGTSSHKTRTGLVIGTPAYMTPEQCEGKGLIDQRSDVYSLGVVMYELLTGRVPFPGEGFGEILVAHLTKQPDPPSALNPDVTPQLEAIVMHAIEKDRNRRFQTMAEFQAAVENPDAHYQSWQGLPAPSLGQHSGGTMMLPDGASSVRPPTGQGQRPITGQRKGPTTQTGPTPTTLSGAASETMNGDDPRPARSSRTPLFAVLGAVAVAGIIGFVAVNKKGASTAASMPPAALHQDEFVTVTVKSDPPGAKVTRGDNDQSAVTPWEMKVKRGAESFDVLVKMDGFTSQTRSINSDRSYAVLVPLEKSAPPAQPVVNPPAPAEQPVTLVVEAPAKDKHHHHSSSSPKAKGETAEKEKPGKEKPASKGGKDEGDDMKLLQPKF